MNRILPHFIFCLLFCVSSGLADDIAELKVKAEKGDAVAQADLAVRYYDGQGVAVDKAQAEKLFRKALSELKVKADLRSKGLLKRGRPVVEGSKNQLKQENRAKLAEAGLLTGKRGRPVVVNSERQVRLAMLNEKRMNGTLKLGRPKMKKEEEA